MTIYLIDEMLTQQDFCSKTKMRSDCKSIFHKGFVYTSDGNISEPFKLNLSKIRYQVDFVCVVVESQAGLDECDGAQCLFSQSDSNLM